MLLRTSPVIDSSGGLFPVMRRAWSLGAGAKLGDGSQHMPLIQLGDYLRFVLWAAENGEASGPYNLTIPQPTTNGEFTDELAGQLHRPRFLKAPKAVLSAVLGDFAEQLLGDVWLLPQQATDQGFDVPGSRRADRHPVLVAGLSAPPARRRAPLTGTGAPAPGAQFPSTDRKSRPVRGHRACNSHPRMEKPGPCGHRAGNFHPRMEIPAPHSQPPDTRPPRLRPPAALSLDFLYPGPLGTREVDYLTAWESQRQIHAEVKAGERPDTVLLLEHASVYTAGKRTEPQERPLDGTPVVDVDRGGKITWHGPGQLVGYPIVKLPEAVYVVDYVRRLEEALIDLCADYGLDAAARVKVVPESGCPPRPVSPNARSRPSASGWLPGSPCTVSPSTSTRICGLRRDHPVRHHRRRGHVARGRDRGGTRPARGGARAASAPRALPVLPAVQAVGSPADPDDADPDDPAAGGHLRPGRRRRLSDRPAGRAERRHRARAGSGPPARSGVRVRFDGGRGRCAPGACARRTGADGCLDRGDLAAVPPSRPRPDRPPHRSSAPIHG